MVGIDGYSGAGKTTLLKKLKARDPKIVPVYMDDFAVVATSKKEAEKNAKLYPDNLVLKFSRDKGLQELRNKVTSFKKSDGKVILIVEGVFLLHPDVLADYLDRLIFVETNTNYADKRRVSREKERWKENYRSEDDPISYVGGFNINFNKYIELYDPKSHADLVVNNGGAV